MIDTIIIPVLNRFDLLERCIRSLGSFQRLIIMDNSDSLDATLVYEWAEPSHAEQGSIHVLNLPSNLGVASSWNLGVKLAPFATGWLFLNSDAWFVDDAYQAFADDLDDGIVVQAGDPPWCCTWISADAMSRVGLFCERFYPAYMEDVDWDRRAQIHGIEYRRSAANVGHDNSSTITADPHMRYRNIETHGANALFYDYRWSNLENGLPREYEWRLATRRAQAWE